MSIQLVPGEPDKTTKIGSQLSPTLAGQLTTFLEQNADIFAWTANDLIGIDPSVIVHSLNVDPTYPSVKQKKRRFGPEKDKVIQEELGRNMEVYVDDMLVKSRQIDWHLTGLLETFNTLRRYRMKINPAKYAFGVRSGKFLGYLVTEKGIEVNPERIRAIQEMKPLTNLNEVQRLAGRIAALSRFISQSAERSLPFFKALRKTKDFTWDDECQQAFQELKVYLTRLLLLTKPVPGETLYLYLAAGPQAVSSVLIKEEGGLQKPIYYVSKVLHGAEQRYPEHQGTSLGGIHKRSNIYGKEQGQLAASRRGLLNTHGQWSRSGTHQPRRR
ncbi:UNVERIFIED_CONTAM: hypothetical protein Slati_2540300 [Sesamum latifolium]|uniref:Reverse transcriptase/retrotransposon-derived protein RNase H-like domain-containing protein n=1 Tax=Sesamum latifolium TaxID=2727402 RepID=A0AAW2WGF1_9LAMI